MRASETSLTDVGRHGDGPDEPMAEHEVLVTPPREDANDLTLTVSAVKLEAHDLILEFLERALALLLQH